MEPEVRIRIDVHALSLASGFTTILHPTSFSAFPGEVVGVLGPSGAGKSTLIKRVSGYARDASGEVLYDGVPLYAQYERLKGFVGYVPQDDIVHPSLTARDELLFAARLRLPDLTEAQLERRVEETLALLELRDAADRRIHRLSGGQRKRVSMGVELLTGPPVLFLDEPTSGLDPALEEKMMALFQTLARQGRTVMVTTHVMESIDRLDLLLLLMKGHLIFFAPPEEALRYFQVASFADIYQRLDDRPPPEWQSRFKASPLHTRYVEKRLAAPLTTHLPEERVAAIAPSPSRPAETDAPDGAARAATASRPAEMASPEAADSIDDELEALRKEIEG